MFTTLSKARAEIDRLTDATSKHEVEIGALNDKIASLSQERDEAREAEAAAKQQLIDAQSNVELTESVLKEARNGHESIEERIESEATQRALDISASAGTRPVEDSSDADLDPDEVTKDNFWSKHASLEPQAKQDFYNQNKHVIGRLR